MQLSCNLNKCRQFSKIRYIPQLVSRTAFKQQTCDLPGLQQRKQQNNEEFKTKLISIQQQKRFYTKSIIPILRYNKNNFFFLYLLTSKSKMGGLFISGRPHELYNSSQYILYFARKSCARALKCSRMTPFLQRTNA